MSRARFRDETRHLRAIGEGDFSNPEGLRYLCNGTGKLSDLPLPLHHPPSPPPASSIQHFSFQRFSFTKTPLFSRTPFFPASGPATGSFNGLHPKSKFLAIHHATGPSPTGPWAYQGTILTSDERHKGPRHHSISRHPDSEEWLIFYHRWENASGPGPDQGSRQIAADRLVHLPMGRIQPVRMTAAKPPVPPATSP